MLNKPRVFNVRLVQKYCHIFFTSSACGPLNIFPRKLSDDQTPLVPIKWHVMDKGYITCHAHYEHSFYYYYTYILNLQKVSRNFFIKLNVALVSILQKLKTHSLFSIFLVPNVESIVRVYFKPDKKVKVTMSPLT